MQFNLRCLPCGPRYQVAIQITCISANLLRRLTCLSKYFLIGRQTTLQLSLLVCIKCYKCFERHKFKRKDNLTGLQIWKSPTDEISPAGELSPADEISPANHEKSPRWWESESADPRWWIHLHADEISPTLTDEISPARMKIVSRADEISPALMKYLARWWNISRANESLLAGFRLTRTISLNATAGRCSII